MKSLSAVSFSLAALLVFGTASSAQAQDAEQKPASLFEKLDVNDDGKLSADEFDQNRRRYFERLVRVGDKNDDGDLSREEFQNALREDQPQKRTSDSTNRGRDSRGRDFNPNQFFERMDQNQDGKLSLNEFPEAMRPRMKPLFERLNKDAISLEEFSKARSYAGRNDSRPQTGADYFRRFDRNKDGKLSLQEFPEEARQRMRPIFETAGKDALSQEDFARVMAARSRQRSGNDRPDADGNRRPEESDRPRTDGDRDRRPAEGDRGRRPEERDRDRRPDDRGRDGRPPEGFGGPAFFRILDQNRDGRLSKEELEKAAEKLMELDRNKDGSLEPRELFGDGPPQGFRGPRGPRGPFGPRPGFDSPFRRPEEGDRPEGRRPDDARPDRRRHDDASPERKRPDGSVQKPREDSRRGFNRDSRRGEGAPRFLDELFKRSDKNSDGKLSRDEAPERLRERFSRLDADNDGSLTLEEMSRGFGRRGDRGFRGKRLDDQPRKKDGE